MKLPSYTITQGRDRAPARAMLKAIGFTDEDLKKPIIGVANTWIETMPCNYNLRELAKHVKAGIREAGGTPMEFNTIAISDGVTMGTEGMKASLVSRDLIADSIELVGRGHMFDGMVALVACDKNDSRRGDGFAQAERPERRIVWRLDSTGPLPRPRPHDSGCFRGGGRERRRPHHQLRVACNRERGVSRRGGVRRPIHRQHHGNGDGNDRAFANEFSGRAAGGSAQGKSCL